MDAWARRAIVLAILAAVAASVSLVHPTHRGRRLGLAMLCVGLVGWGIVNVLADHGDLPERPLRPCDDTRDGSESSCVDNSLHWTDLFALPALTALAGLGILVGKGLRDWVAGRRAAT